MKRNQAQLFVCIALALQFSLRAQTNIVSTNLPATRLPDVIVTGRADSMLGLADSAAQGTIGAKQLADRPILRAGELLEAIPGVIITQHAGGGKANQYFLRGFNLDHGTDIALDLDGMPLNLPSHAHGPGYSDMNIVIPELVQRINYEKGPYFANDGDFSSAGAGHLEFFKSLPQPMMVLEAGMYGYERAMFAASSKVGSGQLLYGGEAFHDDGPWLRPDDYQKFNGLITYSQGDESRGFSLTAHGYHGQWNSSDQIAESAVSTGVIPFFGTLNPTDGGTSQRYSVQGEWHREDADSTTKIMAYGFYYDLNLFSDFTYFLVDTNRGDQFEQQDHRLVEGLKASHTMFNRWWGRDVANTFGLQVRNDSIDNGLYQTQNRLRVSKTDTNGVVLPAVTRQDAITETSGGFYYENKINWAENFRSILGLRGDIYFFDVNDMNPVNSGRRATAVASPKLSLIFGPWAKTEFYVNGGFGYHSDDARGTSATINPDGTPAGKLNGLFQTKGAEIGVRTLAVPHLQSSFSLWYLHSDSELLFEGDTGNTVNSPQPSNRYGIEWANYWTPTEHLTFDLDYADSIARFTSPDSGGGERVPEAINQVLSAGVTLHDLHGFTASLRLRYFGPRDLISTGAYQSRATTLVNLGVGYKFNKQWSLSAEVFNLFDSRDHDIDYVYESRVRPGDAPSTQDHFHPVEPIQCRFALTARF